MPVLFANLVERLLFLLDAVATLNGIEVLQAVNHYQRKEDGDSAGEQAHFAYTHRVGSLDQPRVVNVPGKIELGPRSAPPELRLLGQQLGVALGNTSAPAAAGFKIGCCACGHGGSPSSNSGQGSGVRVQFLAAPCARSEE